MSPLGWVAAGLGVAAVLLLVVFARKGGQVKPVTFVFVLAAVAVVGALITVGVVLAGRAGA